MVWSQQFDAIVLWKNNLIRKLPKSFLASIDSVQWMWRNFIFLPRKMSTSITFWHFFCDQLATFRPNFVQNCEFRFSSKTNFCVLIFIWDMYGEPLFSTLWSIKMCTFYFHANFGIWEPILIIFHRSILRWTAEKDGIRITTSPQTCYYTTLRKLNVQLHIYSFINFLLVRITYKSDSFNTYYKWICVYETEISNICVRQILWINDFASHLRSITCCKL